MKIMNFFSTSFLSNKFFMNLNLNFFRLLFTLHILLKSENNKLFIKSLLKKIFGNFYLYILIPKK